MQRGPEASREGEAARRSRHGGRAACTGLGKHSGPPDKMSSPQASTKSLPPPAKPEPAPSRGLRCAGQAEARGCSGPQAGKSPFRSSRKCSERGGRILGAQVRPAATCTFELSRAV